MDSNCHPPPLSSQKKLNACFWITQLLMIGPAGPRTQPISSQENEMLIFGLRSTSDDQPGLVDGLEPHLQPLSSQKN